MMSLRNMIRGLENDSPAKELIALWDHDAGTLKFWRASSNFVYVFDRNGVRHYLRFIHEEDNTAGNIQAELDFMQYLLDQGYPTVAPVRSINGAWMEKVLTASGLYYGVVFEQAKGKHIPLEQMSDIQFEEWGRSLAELHLLSEKYTPQAPYKSWQDALAFVSSVLRRYPHEAGLRQELERLREQLSELPAGAGHTGLIHYDFETDNIFYDDEEQRYCAIDFDDAMIHWYMMDVASAVSDLYEQDGEEGSRRIGQFLTGYRSIKALDEKYLSLRFIFQKFADLYMFARLLRSVEDMDDSSSPEWAVKLKNKLLGACDRIRER
ncbi:Ser/Thr protein kinase RdoA (MazF antagonist) [Paenibacillus forsythiae]|uniref:Ser/Thr protein kinase RdoA (MazF antagonist) n=1 Tax=Paenibacillus forsythiae TaxID=365616 RepID=A0ABU3H6E8_9BACL|nr:phosphotransferase [Paenibacillus forsythiae]MDT3426399.1 Ser/Thr protein kinase RdoA (MazF antagonist) [Paenibacillus forsythiae]